MYRKYSESRPINKPAIREEEEEILFCHNNSTIKYNCKNNIHGRMPEKAHAHRGWPPMVINNA